MSRKRSTPNNRFSRPRVEALRRTAQDDEIPGADMPLEWSGRSPARPPAARSDFADDPNRSAGRWETEGTDTPLEWYGDYSDAGDRFSRAEGLGRERSHRRHAAWDSGAARALLTVGRVIFGGFFLYNGINHLKNREALAGYAGMKQVPAPSTAVVGSGLLLLIGGLSLISGARPKLGASAITTFLVGVSPMMHDYWNAPPEQRQSEQINFMKNMALVGAALMVASAPEPWPYAVKA